MSKDYYNILGLQKTATASEIKKAYHKLAMKYHPDRNKGDKNAEDKFKEINEAYEVLSDPQKKARFDQYGSYDPGQQSGHGGFSDQAGFNFNGFGNVNFDDIINEVFGMGSRRQHSQQSMAQPGADIRYDLSISLEEAFAGTTSKISFRTFCLCNKCGGFGNASGKESDVCPVCRGSGVLYKQQGFFTVEQTCLSCGGLGRVIKNPCTFCSGLGRVLNDKNLEVTIPKGVDDGVKIRLSGEGECGVRGGHSGDLYVFVSVKPHNIFKRNGKDLWCKVPISITTAALGKEIEVFSINKAPIQVKIPSGTQTGQQFRLKGYGMPSLKGNTCGDLLVEVCVETPVKLTKRQKEILQELEDGNNGNTPMSSGFFSKFKDFFAEK
ncbi:MAG: molecular chaperone DnaJ [Holosporales bacterium]|jgi:molecular chaperone DnaJ|nr:molecular chaperone DnaJ [Holosporales bacterium]